VTGTQCTDLHDIRACLGGSGHWDSMHRPTWYQSLPWWLRWLGLNAQTYMISEPALVAQVTGTQCSPTAMSC